MVIIWVLSAVRGFVLGLIRSGNMYLVHTNNVSLMTFEKGFKGNIVIELVFVSHQICEVTGFFLLVT